MRLGEVAVSHNAADAIFAGANDGLANVPGNFRGRNHIFLTKCSLEWRHNVIVHVDIKGIIFARRHLDDVAFIHVGAGDDAVGIKSQLQASEEVVVPDSGHDVHRSVICVCEGQRIFSVHFIRAIVVRVVGEELVTASGDDEVHASQLGRQFHVSGDGLHVADQDDFVHARIFEGRDLVHHSRHHILSHTDITRARDAWQFWRGQTDDSDLFSSFGEDGACRKAAGRFEWGKVRICAEVEVGAQIERRSQLVAVDEICEHFSAEVEVVVAEAQGIVVQTIERKCVVKHA